MSPEEFKKQYLGGFEPDPKLKECVDLLRAGSIDVVRDLKLDGYFDYRQVEGARRIIEQEVLRPASIIVENVCREQKAKFQSMSFDLANNIANDNRVDRG